ncbi:MAG: acyl-CoA thioesterase [Pseudomonadota bacterium]
MAASTASERRKPPLGIFDLHRMRMRCLPWDMDMFLEMNNGRILTLYDIGRFAMSQRVGLFEVLKREGWGLVVAGSTIRYRSRITAFQMFEMRTRLVGWDDKFFYIEQSMWRGETCCNHGLLRTGVTEKGRLAPTEKVAVAMGVTGPSPDLPPWVTAWIEGDATRSWPPEM